MELATLQLPMVLFTTLVPMASGAFIGLAIMFFTTHFSDACLKRIDLWTLLPIGITVVGFAWLSWRIRAVPSPCSRASMRAP